MSKKSIDLTKDYSKSSIDSKDTSRDFATNELSKDSTVDLSKDYSKASVESVRDLSKSIDEKTFSEDHSSLDVSKTLASDGSEALTISREFISEDKSTSKIVKASSSSSHETSVMTESKIFSEIEDKTRAFEKVESEKDLSVQYSEKCAEKIKELDEEAEQKDVVPDMSELNRRCSNLLEDISQSAVVRIDSSHVTQG